MSGGTVIVGVTLWGLALCALVMMADSAVTRWLHRRQIEIDNISHQDMMAMTSPAKQLCELLVKMETLYHQGYEMSRAMDESDYPRSVDMAVNGVDSYTFRYLLRGDKATRHIAQGVSAEYEETYKEAVILLNRLLIFADEHRDAIAKTTDGIPYDAEDVGTFDQYADEQLGEDPDGIDAAVFKFFVGKPSARQNA